MDIWEANKLTLFIAFVIPGFVSLKTYEILFLSTPKSTTNQIIDAIAYSCLNYAILSPAIYYAYLQKIGSSHPIWFGLFCIISLFLAPMAWVCILREIRQSNQLKQWLPHPTERAWDFVFGNRIPYWLVITMKNGKRIGGKYGYKSFSTSGASKEQIYLEESWEINADGGFDHPKETTAGILIISNEIESIELFQLIEKEAP